MFRNLSQYLMRRIPHLALAMLLAVSLSSAAGSAAVADVQQAGMDAIEAPAPGGLVTSPSVDGLALSAAPQYLEVAGETVDGMSLTDDTGSRIAFTTRPDGKPGLPRLLPGQYELTAGGQVARFAVAGPAAKLSGIGWDFEDPPATWPAWPLAGALVALGGGFLLGRRRTRLLAVLPFAAAGCVAWAAFSVSGASAAPAPVDACLTGNMVSTDQEQDCAMRRLTYLLSQDKFEQSVDEMAGTGACHDFGHEFARRAFVYIGDRDRLTAPKRSICTEGFLHGLMYNGAMYLGDEDYRTFMSGFCENIKGQQGFSIGSCAHGVGHGWVLRTNGRLADAQSECRAAYSKYPSLSGECSGAAIYEYIRTYSSAEGRQEWLPVDAVEPAQLCAQTPTDGRVELEWCYTALATIHGWDRSAGREYALGQLAGCMSLLGLDRQSLCVSGVARTFANAMGHDPANGSVCLTGMPEGPLRQMCASLLAFYIANNTLDDSRSGEVCEAAGLEPGLCKTEVELRESTVAAEPLAG